MANATEELLEERKLATELPDRVRTYPLLRYMGSKHRLLGWIADVIAELQFDSVLDAFSGSATVSYLLKNLGKRVFSNDFLHFSYILAKGTVENREKRLTSDTVNYLLQYDDAAPTFVYDTFRDVFFSAQDLRFIDQCSYKIRSLPDEHIRSLALSCLLRSCIKKQPRGVFTVSGDAMRYDDGRRDLRLSIHEHFLEQIDLYNATVFDNGENNLAFNMNIFDFDEKRFRPDLVYLDPPYVPKSDDNCYVKRYHFLEGLSKYWQNEEIMYETKVKKIKKKYTPFSYRKSAVDAFDRLFAKFEASTIVLSYSSNGFPDIEILESLLRKYKPRVTVHQREHRYHFGTHSSVKRAKVDEYLVIGADA